MSDTDPTLIVADLEPGDKVLCLKVEAREGYLIERKTRVVDAEPNLKQVAVARRTLTMMRNDLGLATYVALRACVDGAARAIIQEGVKEVAARGERAHERMVQGGGPPL